MCEFVYVFKTKLFSYEQVETSFKLSQQLICMSVCIAICLNAVKWVKLPYNLRNVVYSSRNCVKMEILRSKQLFLNFNGIT